MDICDYLNCDGFGTKTVNMGHSQFVFCQECTEISRPLIREYNHALIDFCAEWEDKIRGYPTAD